jgi:sarcosine oxidase
MQLGRRHFFQTAATALAGRKALAQGAGSCAVVGAGAFGGWTALSLQQQGLRTTLIDGYGPGNARAASGGESRLVRARHTDEIYLEMALRAFELWRHWEARWQEQFLVPSGYLNLLDPGPLPPRVTDAVKLLEPRGIATEVLTQREVSRRYPQFETADVGQAYWEPGGATARPRDSCLRVARAVAEGGGEVVQAWAEPGRREGGRLVELQLSNGKTVQADTFVFATGPWLGRTFPDLLGKKIRTPRREVFFLGPPARDQRFAHPACPAWADSTALGAENSYYGFADFDGRGFRVIPANDGNELDPDSDERVASAWQLQRLHKYVGRRFPALAGQPVVGSRVCQVEYTPDMGFLIDRHPELENVWIVGGGSGQGFKHGPSVGELAAKRVLEQPADERLTQAFGWRPAFQS